MATAPAAPLLDAVVVEEDAELDGAVPADAPVPVALAPTDVVDKVEDCSLLVFILRLRGWTDVSDVDEDEDDEEEEDVEDDELVLWDAPIPVV